MYESFKLTDSLSWTGVLDKNLRVFDIIMYTEFGSTYNSYVLKGSEKTAIFETAKLKFYDEFKERVESQVKFEDLDYIIVNHTEPDHAGSIEKILDINPKVQLVGTSTALGFLKEITNRDFYSITVKDGDTLCLGDKTLRFLALPNLHWPDTMYSYIEEDKVLITCDSFGSHYCHEDILHSKITDKEGYKRATKYYFDNIIGPFVHPFMVKALERIESLEINMICPGHGPVHDGKESIDEIMSWYNEWCKKPEKTWNKLVVIPYVSAYGYTKELSEQIIAGIKEAGDIEVRAYDMVEADQEKVLAEIAIADGLLFGTPTIVGEALLPIWELVVRMFPPVHSKKLASAFGSYGWSGEAVPHIIERLKQLRCKVPDEGFRIRLKPSEKNLIDARDYGYNFGCLLLKKENERKTKKSGRNMVKCIVCGEVFDADEYEVCPVCSAGPDKFVEAVDTTPEFRKDTDEKFVIIGGGSAALYAARAIRERNATAKITMVSEEEVIPYNRPMLTKELLADISEGTFAITDKNWFEENKVDLMLGTRVESIDVKTKTVKCKGEDLSYDKLIYALGAHCFMAPIKGKDQDHVLSIRSVADVKYLQGLIGEELKKVVIIGGGVMGLESAWELKKAGHEVTVLEGAPRLLPKQLDTKASELLAEILTKEEINFVVGAKIAEIKKKSVALEDGTEYDADIVIMSTGMRGNIEIAKEAGLEIDKLIKVDETMLTSAPDVYAAGDCAEFEGVPAAFWSQSIEMGRIAGANAAGDEEAYSLIPSSMNIAAMNTEIFSMGDVGVDENKEYRTIELADANRGEYEKYYFEHNRLVGVILIGDISKQLDLMKALEENRKFSEFMK